MFLHGVRREHFALAFALPDPSRFHAKPFVSCSWGAGLESDVHCHCSGGGGGGGGGGSSRSTGAVVVVVVVVSAAAAAADNADN